MKDEKDLNSTKMYKRGKYPGQAKKKSRWGARFSASVQTGPGVHQASCTMVAVSLSRG
jgi:hypothetical protein